MMTAKCEAKTEATVSGGSPRVRRSRPGPNMRLLFAGVDKNRTPAEQRARIPSIIFNEKKFPEKTIPGGGHGKPLPPAGPAVDRASYALVTRASCVRGARQRVSM
jgi:hypothetical protein